MTSLKGLTALSLAAALLSVAGTAPEDDRWQTDAAGWRWPLASFEVDAAFSAPAHAYAPGHRGIDLVASDGVPVLAPSDGVVAFSGPVAGRGILTIDHGDGYVTTLEPVVSEATPGTVVTRGDAVAHLAIGGHTPAGSLHFGIRLHGEYINPLALLGGVPRAVLLPCC